MRDVYVAGVCMIKFGRYRDRDVPDLGGEAVLLALDDAGLALRDVELLAAGSLFQANAMVGQRILQQVGQTGIPVVNVANACATGSTAFREAWLAVRRQAQEGDDRASGGSLAHGPSQVWESRVSLTAPGTSPSWGRTPHRRSSCTRSRRS